MTDLLEEKCLVHFCETNEVVLLAFHGDGDCRVNLQDAEPMHHMTSLLDKNCLVHGFTYYCYYSIL